MRQDDVLIKWTGSKRHQASQIIQFFPPSINTYYEPFLGGGSMLYVLLCSDIPVRQYFCSDLNATLIEIWDLIKTDPQKLLEHYTKHWPFDSESYYELRKEFNKTYDPLDFFCLLRTCRNGLIRYNRKGEFTSGFHQRRRGIRPEKLSPVLDDWCRRLNNHNVQLQKLDYAELQSLKGDFLYLDPPYVSEDEFYQGRFDLDRFWKWLAFQQGRWALSFNADVPEHLYCQKEIIQGGFQRVNRLDRIVAQHDLYLGNI